MSLIARILLTIVFLGALIGAGAILTVSYGYKLVRGVIGMGGGDVVLMAMVGAFLGPWGGPAVLFGGAFLGTAWALVAGRGRVQGQAKLPFGTFLAAAAAVRRSAWVRTVSSQAARDAVASRTSR